MEDDEGAYSDFRVFVSRLPTNWNTKLITEHFSSMGFGIVVGAEVFTSKRKARVGRGEGNICYAFKNDGKCERGAACPFVHGDAGGASDEADSLGSGCVYFETEEGMKRALEQRSLYVSHRTIKISPFQTVDDGRDVTACHAWARGQCTHGDECKFSHDGPGACMVVGKPYSGRKFQCLSYKSKGKCSKGDFCTFLHVLREKGEGKEEGKVGGLGEGKGKGKGRKDGAKDKALDNVSTGKRARSTDGEGGGDGEGDGDAEGKAKVETGVKRGVCHAFQKKGCKKGERCIFEHVEKAQGRGAGIGGGADKRRKIDGKMLVERRRENKITTFDDGDDK